MRIFYFFCNPIKLYEENYNPNHINSLCLVVTNCSPKVVNQCQNDGEVVLPCPEERRATDHFVGFGNSTSSDVGRSLDKAAAFDETTLLSRF